MASKPGGCNPRALAEALKLPLRVEMAGSYHSRPQASDSKPRAKENRMLVFIRAVVMLAVLVGLPAAWIYYGPLPPGAQRVVDRVLEVVMNATGWQQPSENPLDAKAAPRFSVAAEPAPALSIEPVSLPLAAAGAMPERLAEQVEPLLERLRALGPTEYSLEPWGRQGEFFRFRCAMPLTPDHEVTRQFAAVAPTPLASIEQVMGEVANWRTARLGEQRLQ